MRIQTKERGITLVEVLFGVAIMGIVLVFVSFTIVLFLSSSKKVLNQTKALYLAEEGIEILRYLRDGDWDVLDSELSESTTYYFTVSDTSVGTTTVPEIIDSTYTRSFVYQNAERDGNDDITTSGTEDTDTKDITVTVSWGSDSVSLQTLLTNLSGT